MKKRFFPVLFLVSLLLFSCKGLTEALVADVDAIRSNISLTFEITNDGMTFNWTKPNHLDSHAERYFITDDSSSSSSSPISCFKVPSRYQDSRYSDNVSIGKNISSVTIDEARIACKLYLWTEIDYTYYNLGQFQPTVTTAVTQIKSQIKLNVDTTDISNLKFQWAIPNYLSINPLRFIISKNDSSKQAANYTFDCLVIDSLYRDYCFEDTVSIKRNCYTVQNSYKTYDVVASSKNPQDYYLWIQIEDGSWWNLGQFDVRKAGGSQGGTSTTVTPDLTSIRNSIDLTYSFTDGGTKLTWTKPTGLASITQYFMISENPDESATGSLSCKRIPSAYVDTTRNDETSIKASLNSVTLEWKVKTSQKLYLWIYSTSGTYYNLGQFTIPSSQITNIKNYIQIEGDKNNIGSFDPNGYLFWKIPASYTLNAMRFVVSSDSASSYSSDTSFSCRRVESEYRESFYDDNVSIRPDCYLTVSNWNEYSIYLESQLTSGYYLWVQIEDGSWYNLGRITYL
jgi:hypothetical protein